MASDEIDPNKYLQELLEAEVVLEFKREVQAESEFHRYGDWIKVKLPNYTLLVPFSTYRLAHYVKLQNVMVLIQEAAEAVHSSR